MKCVYLLATFTNNDSMACEQKAHGVQLIGVANKNVVSATLVGLTIYPTVVWMPAPSQEEEGSGTLRINDLFC